MYNLYHKQTSFNFLNSYILQLIIILYIIYIKKLKIINYILYNVHLSNNTMIATTREIAKATGTSLQTVIT
ncbi:replication/maintenance protein RepL, partial [Staphylococcus aureus]|uniref:replication/maintenance protein RepL n=1 Tax=Staphylococcus aureus TaxID=1280 RepID=UPI0028164FC9